VLFVLASVAFALRTPVVVFNRTSGLNLTNAAELFLMRNTTLEEVFIRKAYNGIFGSCESMTSTKSDIGGGVLIGDASNEDYSFYIPPSVVGFHYTTENHIDYKDLGRLIYYGSYDDDPVYQTFIALTFPGVIEVDQQNRYITHVSFNTSGKPANETWTPFKKLDDRGEGISAYSSTLKVSNGAEFRLTMIVSDVAGVIEYGYTPVSPTSVSFVVEIENWPYRSRFYKLGLVIGTGIKINEGHFRDNYTSRESRDGSLLSYVDMPGYALVDEQLVSVRTLEDAASVIRRTSLVYNSDAVNMMGIFLFDGKPYTRFRCVLFPETAQNMVYGTAVGAGAPIYSYINVPAGTYSSASSVFISLVAVLLAFMLIF